MTRWLVDGNNLMGAHPDGWWRDRAGATARWAERVARWAETHEDPVLLMFDGAPVADALGWSMGTLTVAFARRRGRDAADDELAAAAAGCGPETVVVSADRGLLARLPQGVRTEGPRAFAARLPR